MKVTERFEKCYEIVCMMRNAESSLNEAMYYANDLGEDMKATEERIKKILMELTIAYATT